MRRQHGPAYPPLYSAAGMMQTLRGDAGTAVVEQSTGIPVFGSTLKRARLLDDWFATTR